MGVDLNSDATLRVARVLHGTVAEGPGRRTAIWVQGCSIRCRGCINPHLFDVNGGNDVEIASIVDEAVRSGDEGVTLLGGEPFDQASACAQFARACKDAGLGVICFTGYEHETLTTPDATDLLAHVDLLVDGPYIAREAEHTRALVGSTNQRFIHLTPRYSAYDPTSSRNRLELRLNDDGTVDAAGFLKSRQVTRLAVSLTSRRDKR